METEMAERANRFYPKEISPLYTPSCIDHRIKFNDRMHRYMQRRIADIPSERQYFSEIANEKNIIIPFENILDKLYRPFDIISVSCVKDDSAFSFLEHHSPNNSSQEAVGKTAIALKLLKLEVPYDEIPDKDCIGEILQGGMKKILSKNGKVKLLCSNMSYVGAEDGSLAISAVKGEPFVAQWDLARNIYREKDPYYYSGKQREPSEIPYQEAIGEMYYLDQGMFASNKKTYPITKIFIVNRKSKFENCPTIEKVPTQDTLETLKRILTSNPLYHTSTFWKENEAEHKIRVKDSMESLDIDNLPEIRKIHICPYINRQKDEAQKEKITEAISEQI